MRSSAGNSTVVLRYKTANSSLTISEKEEIMNKRIGPVQVLQESVSKNSPDSNNRYSPFFNPKECYNFVITILKD